MARGNRLSNCAWALAGVTGRFAGLLGMALSETALFPILTRNWIDAALPCRLTVRPQGLGPQIQGINARCTRAILTTRPSPFTAQGMR